MAYLKFALEEPKLFHLLFMNENSPSPELSVVLSKIDDNSNQILKTIQEQYHLELTEANKLYLYLWIFTHGIATLAVNGVCRFTSDEMSAMLTDVFTDILKGRKRSKNDSTAKYCKIISDYGEYLSLLKEHFFSFERRCFYRDLRLSSWINQKNRSRRSKTAASGKKNE